MILLKKNANPCAKKLLSMTMMLPKRSFRVIAKRYRSALTSYAQ